MAKVLVEYHHQVHYHRFPFVQKEEQQLLFYLVMPMNTNKNKKHNKIEEIPSIEEYILWL